MATNGENEEGVNATGIRNRKRRQMLENGN
jgi:hypothetical protein